MNDTPPEGFPPASLRVDARNQLCPLPILKAEAAMERVGPGEVVAVVATDPGLRRDLPAWCAINGHTCLGLAQEGRELTGWVRKGTD